MQTSDRSPTVLPNGDAAVRLGKYLWSHLPRDTTMMRRQIGRRWLTHEVVRAEEAVGPWHFEHIVPVLVFALRHEIHGDEFSADDSFGCVVTTQEHQVLLKLRSAPHVLIPALACERHQLLDVCLRRYFDAGLRLVELPERVRAPRAFSGAAK